LAESHWLLRAVTHNCVQYHYQSMNHGMSSIITTVLWLHLSVRTGGVPEPVRCWNPTISVVFSRKNAGRFLWSQRFRQCRLIINEMTGHGGKSLTIPLEKHTLAFSLDQQLVTLKSELVAPRQARRSPLELALDPPSGRGELMQKLNSQRKTVCNSYTKIEDKH